MGGITFPRLGALVITIFILLEGFFEILITYLRAKISPNFTLFTGLRILPRIIFALALLMYEAGFWTSLYLYIFSSSVVLTYLIHVVIQTIKLNQPFSSFSFLTYKELLIKLFKYSTPMMVAAISFPLLNFIVRGNIMHIDGYSSLGIFSIYMSFTGILIYFPEAFQSYIFPKLAELADDDDSYKKGIYRQFGSLLFFSLLVCFLFVLTGPFFLDTLYPKSIWTYADSILIASTAFLWTLYKTLERFYLIFFPSKNYLITCVSFLSLLFAAYISYSLMNIGSGAGRSLIVIFSYFLVSSCILGVIIRYRSLTDLKSR